MAKLIDKIKVGMSMEEVRKIIPYKPDLIYPENPMSSQVGKTIWYYSNSKGSLKIFFQDALYIAHKIIPILERFNEGEEIEFFVGDIKLEKRSYGRNGKKIERLAVLSLPGPTKPVNLTLTTT